MSAARRKAPGRVLPGPRGRGRGRRIAPRRLLERPAQGDSGRISDLAAVEAEERATPFPARFTRSILHRPALAFGSLAAALALVAGISVLRGGTEALPPAGAAAVASVAAGDPAELSAADRDDDELLRSVDSALSGEASQEALLPEVMK